MRLKRSIQLRDVLAFIITFACILFVQKVSYIIDLDDDMLLNLGINLALTFSLLFIVSRIIKSEKKPK